MKQELVLIANDSEDVLAFTSLAVEMMGYAVIKATNGKDAVELTFNKHPDLIIIDWKMPVMNGLEATKLLRESNLFKDIPIIMITGTNESSVLMAQAMEAGVNDFIRKPFDRIELKARIKSQLKQASFVKQIIEIKNNQLNQTAIQLANTLDFQKSILSKLETLSKDVDNTEVLNNINEIIAKIKINTKLNPFETLNKEFLEINNNFTSDLLSKHPNLTPAEIKLCMLLRLNLDTKEISILTFQTYDSVRVSRTRLREKLNLTSSDNLVNYLMQF